MAESPDVAVEDLRKRARRRLVGAILLALIAAVVLPVFLESDPKPLGQDVSIQIPAIDSGKSDSSKSAAGGSLPAPAKAASDGETSARDRALPAPPAIPAPAAGPTPTPGAGAPP